MSFLSTVGALIGVLALVATAGMLITLRRADRLSENGRSAVTPDATRKDSASDLSTILTPELTTLETQLHFLRESFGNIESLCGLFQETLLAAKDNRLDKNLLDKADETARRLDMEYLKSEVPKALKESLQTIRRIQNLIR